MGTRSGKLVAADESTVPAESLFDLIVVEDFESNRRLPNPPCTDESNGFEDFGEPDDLFDQLVASKTVPRRRGRQFTKRGTIKT
jgi:hypothetical protein